MSVSVRVQTGIMSTDTRWLNGGWSQHQAVPKQPRRHGPSESRLLHCRQMAVKEKQSVNKAKTYSHEVSQRGQTEKERTKKTAVAFVTKVQIKRRAQRTSSLGYVDDNMAEEDKEGATCVTDRELDLLSEEERDDVEHGAENGGPTDTRANDVPVDVYPSRAGEDAEDIQGMIRSLSRRLGESSAELRRRQSAKPLASFARPTKGELNLSEKGPVVLAPVLMSQGIKRGQMHEQNGGKDKKERRGANQRRESAHDDILVQGTRSIGHRLSRSAPEGVGLGLTDPRKPLCSCCRGSLLADYAEKAVRRSQSASTERGRIQEETKRNSTGRLVKISRHMQRSVPPIHQADLASRLISPCRGTGLFQHAAVTLELGLRLGSRDYGTPVPPSSPDQSDGEGGPNEA